MDTSNDLTPATPAEPTALEWITTQCEKCGRRVQLEARAEDQWFLDQIPYADEDELLGPDSALGCPFCAMSRGGTYWLVREGRRPPRDWELYVLDGTEFLGHVPSQGWYTFPNAPGGWEQRIACDESEALDQVAMLLEDADPESDDLPLRPDMVAGWPELGETGWPQFADARRAYLKEEADEQLHLEAESAEFRLLEPAWTGREAGWELRPGLVADHVVQEWFAWTPAGQAWQFQNVTDGWSARMLATAVREYCQDAVAPEAARLAGYPPALVQGTPE